jgi:hypothetical protein
MPIDLIRLDRNSSVVDKLDPNNCSPSSWNVPSNQIREGGSVSLPRFLLQNMTIGFVNQRNDLPDSCRFVDTSAMKHDLALVEYEEALPRNPESLDGSFQR